MNPIPRTLQVVAIDTMPWRIPDAEGFTVSDLHALPDDGLRYELIDGSIIVSPSATTGHNLIARWIAEILEAASHDAQWLVSTDQSTSINDRNEPRPDLVVAHVRHIDRSPFPIGDTLLVGEVVSPNSALLGTETKRALYARAKVPAYWIVAPDKAKRQIALAELRLDANGAYQHRVHYTTEMFRTDHPWPVEIDLPALSLRWAHLLHLAEEADH
jgi:Uma2 family endonuclease